MKPSLLVAVVALAVVAEPRRVDAGAPTPQTCVIPTHVVLVGTNASLSADPGGTFTVTVRRFTDPVPNSLVYVDLEDATGTRMCTWQPDDGQGVACPPGALAPSVYGFTDIDGRVTFTVVGRANRSIEDSSAPSLRFYADGVLLGTVPVAALDQDGGGLGPSDQSLWLTDFFSGYHERSDFDGDGALGASDLSLWLTAFFAGHSTEGCPTSFCP